MLEQLKGPGQVVASNRSNGNLITILRYADYSWSIRRNDFVLGVWENDQREECFRLFFELVNADQPGRRDVILRIQNLALSESLSSDQPMIN